MTSIVIDFFASPSVLLITATGTIVAVACPFNVQSAMILRYMNSMDSPDLEFFSHHHMLLCNRTIDPITGLLVRPRTSTTSFWYDLVLSKIVRGRTCTNLVISRTCTSQDRIFST